MATCDTPRCGEPGRWQVTATGRRVCAEHIPDGQIHGQPIRHRPTTPSSPPAALPDGGGRRSTGGR